jgi:hypothetical protein
MSIPPMELPSHASCQSSFDGRREQATAALPHVAGPGCDIESPPCPATSLHVRTRHRCQHREGRRVVALCTVQGEPMLRFRIFLASEFEEGACGQDIVCCQQNVVPLIGN